jgi:hypothetical protein
LGAREGFTWRGEEITRIESLSDAVFGFAIALLIVSTEVPKTYNELTHTLEGFCAFAVCFTLLMGIWYKHYLYFRRYNMEDMKSIVLTMILLFLVLFYTYPLKFLFMSFLGPGGPIMIAFGLGGKEREQMITSMSQLEHIYLFYGIGFMAVYAVFAIMYQHAYSMRNSLGLTELEIWDTKHEVRESIMSCGVGLLSIIVAELGEPWINFSGMAYSLMGFVGWAHGSWSRKRRAEIHGRLYPETASVIL